MTMYKEVDWGFCAFEAAAERLREQGHIVVCPSEVDQAVWGFDGRRDRELKEGMTRDKILTLDMQLAASCDAVYMLKLWEKAIGAVAELALMQALGRVIMFEPGALVVPSLTTVLSIWETHNGGLGA
jgi:hypothetical protein